MGVLDLTTLEGTDTPERVEALCARAVRPIEREPSIHVAAVCVYPNFVPVARDALGDAPVKLAAVAGAFPSGQSPLHIRVAEAAWAAERGADEIDMVISRGELLAGRPESVEAEVAAIRDAIGPARLKVILETGELRTEAAIRAACDAVLPLLRDGDFIKTSTGKIQPAATFEASAIMLEQMRTARKAGGADIGIKPAGGIRTTADARAYWSQALEAMRGIDGWDQPNPARFRIGASSLLDALLGDLAAFS